MKYIVSVSGGVGSTLAAHRTKDRFGEKNTILLFSDTNSEDKTLYLGLDSMKTFLSGCEFVHLTNNGETIWDIFHKHGVIKVNGGCKASLELKHKPLQKYIESRFPNKNEIVLVSGLDWTEEDRISRFNRRWEGYTTWHPMTETPRLSYCQQISELNKLGYPDQKMYELGYPHNNCAGGCVLAGMAQWAGLLRDKPDLYEYHLKEEEKFNRHRVRRGLPLYTILKDRRGGSSQPLTLAEFKNRVLSGDTSHLGDFRSTCGCMTPMEDT